MAINLSTVPLPNSEVTYYELRLDFREMHRFLLISDCHIHSDIETWFLELKKVLEKEKATRLFILGDLIDGSLPNGDFLLKTAIKELETLPINVYLIGGNHDRGWVNASQWTQGSNVTIVKDWSILIQIPQKEVNHPLKIYLAHELGNNIRVRDKLAVHYFEWVKNGCRAIKPSDWLICGHAHTSIISRRSKLACIGQFSPEINNWAYSILTIEDSKPSLTGKVVIK